MDIREYVYSKRDFIKKTLAELVAIPSVRSAAKPGAPFGAECRNALLKTSEIYRENGFSVTENFDGGWVSAEYGSGEKSVGLFSHADIVPAGDDWFVTTPFDMVEKDGFYFGRGVTDDKCGTVMSLVAAMALRDLKLPFNKKLVMFTGSSEETGMEDILHFRENAKVPDYNIVLDADFPAYRGEKSMVRFYAVSPCITDERLSLVSGGEAINIVLGKAEAVFDGQKITAEGISKHAAHPDGSLNAGAPLFEKLAALTDAETAAILDRAKELLSTFDGSAFGIESTDPDFGPLTCTNGVIRFKDRRVSLSFDVRFGTSLSADTAADKITEKLASFGWTAENINKNPGFSIPEDDPFVKTLVESYAEFTGKPKKAILSGGGTYSRALKNSVSVGTQIKNSEEYPLPAGHGEEHQPDECINITGLLDATVFITELLLKL